MTKKKNNKSIENTANRIPTQPARSFLEQLKHEAKIQSIASSCRLANDKLSEELILKLLAINNEHDKKGE